MYHPYIERVQLLDSTGKWEYFSVPVEVLGSIRDKVTTKEEPG
jgi:hypothetical protein